MRIADMHCDTMGRIHLDGQCLKENKYHVDLQKMIKADYLVQNFAMFIDSRSVESPFKAAVEMIDTYEREIEKNRAYIRKALSFRDIVDNQADGKMSAVLTLEEGAVLEGKLSYLRTFYRMGVRMMTLTWNYENEIGVCNLIKDGEGRPLFRERNPKGLTTFGTEAVCEMERLGMIVDVSHLSDGGFWDVAKHTKKPFVASHSNAAAVCDVCRNLTDDMIRCLGDRGGVMGLNFCGAFLTQPDSWEKDPDSTVEAIVRHARHIVNTGGIGVCALGTDFDGIPDNLEISDAGKMGMLVMALEKDGFTAEEIEKICYKNVMRVYREVLHEQGTEE
ncbi:dipeptidase [Murimonas intestini]|uniref:dipeptidase n=1 Tax=Murimonas intestini TaxID=1337051 RepID=UPI0011DC8832|nr:dipeptidase [Murimonas intestini]